MNNDSDNFRENLSTADKQGKRLWVYPRKPKGKLYNLRSYLSLFQIVIMVAIPFIKINGRPLFMFNIFDREFVIFGSGFVTRDFPIFALMMIALFIAIALVTAVYGRVFCGWACPQTVFLEMVFRKVEYWIEGDGSAQRKAAKTPLRGKRLLKRLVKLIAFYAISLFISNLFLAYVVGSDQLIELIRTGPSSNIKLFWGVIGFSLVFFFHFTWFREQFCIYLCPYARLQSVLLDNHSQAVAYDYKRGEGRASNRIRKEKVDTKFGDCVDCGLCVQVCPTGIDIRNGFPQLECVNCTACIDACDNIMEANNKPKGLIHHSSINKIETGGKFEFTARVKSYSFLLIALTAVIIVMLFDRSPVDTTFVRPHGSTPIIEGEKSRNLFLIKLVNRTNEDLNLEMRIMENAGMTFIPNGMLTLSGKEVKDVNRILESQEKGQGVGKMQRVKIGIYRGEELLEIKETNYLYPRFIKEKKIK
ncbi:cytochrome c oxidase accessory protein CcoG [Lentisphaera profundi]|uniref:Cytochrome c oxidase accessory protein CcoG n=1 Tax=Lentisphaera profundi TaxID=1658616 RepID=A0ABY7VS59_9BACT|nr:cytochrome c oxidase accessory protein CcoG [Lentisphaera profundi]WDE95727.1 cytochrome c oxidase accessory protein CcoG [Lentisphaera profundi]